MVAMLLFSLLIVINVSHLGSRIMERIGDGERFGLHVQYSRERERLETAGGIANALALLGRKPFLLVNADVYCECDFARLCSVELHRRLAHLVLIPNPPHRPAGAPWTVRPAVAVTTAFPTSVCPSRI